jgi:hypothetical protein
MSEPYVDGTRVDNNLFFMDATEVMAVSQKLGWDENSVFADPEFMDPAGGDFRVKEGSPALDIGFVNFPMDQFGVKKPSLKAIAETPQVPELEIAMEGLSTAGKSRQAYWLGAKIRNLQGEEFSAYGVSQDEGGVALVEVPPGAVAGAYGLRENDLIQAVNGAAVDSVDAFLKAWQASANKSLKLKIVRNQQSIELKFTP